MENIEDRLRKASMTGSIHELQDDSAGSGSGPTSDPPLPEASHPDIREDEEEEIFEDAHEEFRESPVDVSPTKSCQEQVRNIFKYCHEAFILK